MKKSRVRGILVPAVMAIACGIWTPAVHAAAEWNRGTMIDMTSTAAGLMVKLDTGLPTNCIGVSMYGWMLIPEANRTMVAFAMSKWISLQRAVDLYVVVQGGACIVTQVDSQ